MSVATRCQWPGCSAEASQWGCSLHWEALPFDLRSRVWSMYQPGSQSQSDGYRSILAEIREYIHERKQAAVSAAAAEAEKKASVPLPPVQPTLFPDSITKD